MEPNPLREWEAIEKLRLPYYAGTKRRVKQVFAQQQRETLAALDAMFEEKRWQPGRIWQMVQAWAQLFDFRLHSWTVSILRAGEAAGRARIAGLTGEFTEFSPSPAHVDYDILASQVLRSRIVNEETAKEIVRIITALIDDDRGDLVKMRREVRKLFQGFRSFRADRITNTVVVGAFEAGTLEAWRGAGLVTGKQWVSARDGRVRQTHDTRLNPSLLQPIPLEQPFTVGGALLLYPGDPEGPAKEIINCRCTMAPVV